MIRRVEPGHEDVAHLLARLAAHNLATYGDDGLSEAPPEEWLTALVAYEADRPVGMIWIRSLDRSAHLLRLYIEPDARGHGLTGLLARRAVAEARAAGFNRAIWDTSTEAPTAVAVSLALGARPIASFGAHSDDPRTRCFEINLAASADRPGRATVPATDSLLLLPQDRGGRSQLSAVRETLFSVGARVRALARRWSLMNSTSVIPAVEVEEVSVEDGRRMLHEQTMDKLGISRDEFLTLLDSGAYQDTEDEAILRLAMLAPFGR